MIIDITDDLGFELAFTREPSRIVSLVPSLTETLVLMGARARLAGITKYCIHPQNRLAGIPRIGGTKNPSISAILSQQPDLIIANAEENEEKDIDILKKHCKVFITFPKTIEGAVKTVVDLATLTGCGKIGEAWIDRFQMFFNKSKRFREGRPVRSLCLIWRKPWMAAGPDSYISGLLGAFGFTNAIDNVRPRYPRLELEEIKSLKPEVIFLPDEPYRFDRNQIAEIENAFLAGENIPRVLPMDGTMLAWFGWRTLDALKYVMNIRTSFD